jgi:hypothetical protein
MAPSFQSTTWGQLQAELSLRLNDTSNVRWTVPEVRLYLSEALRLYQCLTQQYILDWAPSYTGPITTWQSTGNSFNPLVGANMTSPRRQTLTDSYLYTFIQYHFLEPATGSGTWTGTSQFTLQDFVNAFQRRRDQILQLTDCNVGPFPFTPPFPSIPLSIVPNTNRVQIPDHPDQSVLDVRRVRYLPTSGSPVTLHRDDTMAMEYFDTFYQQSNEPPLTWDVLGSPQQFITFDTLVNVPNTLDVLGIVTTNAASPPTTNPLLIPDDFFWVLKYGMMADLLVKETESKDLLRAAYCEQRFTEGVRVMMELPWLLQGRINNVPVDTPSFYEADQFDYEWQSNPDAMPAIIRGGIDLFAIAPITPAATSVSINLSLVANAVIPATDGDYVQVSREILDVVLDEAEHLAQLKEAGAEFQESIALHQRFISFAMQTNRRLKESGIFPSDLRRPISKEDEAEPRFALEESKA